MIKTIFGLTIFLWSTPYIAGIVYLIKLQNATKQVPISVHQPSSRDDI